MEISIVKAVVRMLDEALVKANSPDSYKEAFAIVKCGKIMLEEITKLDGGDPKKFFIPAPLLPEQVKPLKPGTPELVVENGILKDIKNFDLNMDIKFNEKIMP